MGYSAFWACSGLTSLTIPNGVTSIGTYAFKNCTQLAQITTNISDPGKVSITSDPFENVNKQTCKLYVPKGTVSLYQAAAVWKDFANILEMEDPSPSAIDESMTSTITAHVSGSTITLSGLNDGEVATFYTTSGMTIGSAISSGGEATIDTQLNNQIVIVKIGNSSIKVEVK